MMLRWVSTKSNPKRLRSNVNNAAHRYPRLISTYTLMHFRASPTHFYNFCQILGWDFVFLARVLFSISQQTVSYRNPASI